MGIKHRKNVNLEPFDTKRRPPSQNLLLMLLCWPYLFVLTKLSGLKIKKVNMDGLKPPFIVFGTHQSFYDFYVTPMLLFPYRANYVSELEGFEAFGEGIYRHIGCLGTRKFISDTNLVRNAKWLMQKKRILVIYPEARYANVGTSTMIPKSTAKLCKLLKVPVVIAKMKGNYLKQPIWNLRNRSNVKLSASLEQVCTKEEVEKLSIDEIQDRIEKALSFDEYHYQKEAGILIKDRFRAEGLEGPLYQCISCGIEHEMTTDGANLRCKKCGKNWYLREDGDLQMEISSENSLSDQNMQNLYRDLNLIRIPDWYEWERKKVKDEINAGEYSLDIEVHIEALPNAKSFHDFGIGRLKHCEDGFSLCFHDQNGDDKILKWGSRQCFSIHTEYDYRGLGPCVVLSTDDNSYFLFPVEKKGFNPTKIQFATEYFYDKKQ